jgi:hypothetical protein
MNLDLTSEQAEALLIELDRIINADRFPFSPRIQMLKRIRAQIKPYPARSPLPPIRSYAPPRASVARRRPRG